MTDEAKKPTRSWPIDSSRNTGLDEAPNAGDEFFVVADERKAKEIAEHASAKARQERMSRQQAAKLGKYVHRHGCRAGQQAQPDC